MFKLYKGAWISDRPPHLTEKITEKECRNLLKKGGYLIRNTYHFDAPEPTSFWFIIKDSFEGMEELSSRTRNKVRRALTTYDIRIVPSSDVLQHGLSIYNSALKGYSKHSRMMTQKQLETMVGDHSNNKSGTYEYWMVFDKTTNAAVALSINILKQDCCEYVSLKCNTDYLHNSTYPFYGLFYEMNRYYLQDKSIKYVCDGARSITEHSNIQSFLEEQFNFRKAYCDLQIVYTWWMKLFINALYPFRKIIKHKKTQALLRMEAMRRNKY